MSNKFEQAKVFSKGGESGFSMVEAIIAIFILTIGLIGTASTLR